MLRSLCFSIALCCAPVGCNTTSPPPQTPPDKPSQLVNTSWKIDRVAFNDVSGPSESLTLRVNTSEYLLEENQPFLYQALPRDQWASFGIPVEALSAVKGWWAGHGQAIYAIKSENGIKVYKKDLDEQAVIPPFELVRVLRPADLYP